MADGRRCCGLVGDDLVFGVIEIHRKEQAIPECSALFRVKKLYCTCSVRNIDGGGYHLAFVRCDDVAILGDIQEFVWDRIPILILLCEP